MQRTNNGTPVWIDGTGPPVVLIHGVMMDHRMWEPQVRALRDAYTGLGLMEQGGVESVDEPAMQRWFNAREKRERSAEIDEVIGWMRDDEFTPKIKAYRVFVNADSPSAEMLRSVQCPALVMTGDGDVGSTPQMSRRMAEELPAAQLQFKMLSNT